MKYSMDISSRKNIVMEGITDRMYLEAGIKGLGISDEINNIPSNGVASIANVVSILFGWG